MTSDEGRLALSFLWEGQDGIFELATWPDQRSYYAKDVALQSLDGKRYFAPLARTCRGSKKKDVAPTGNVLWVDIDSLDAPDRLSRLPFEPSLFLFSGNKGYWAYYKLSAPIPTDQIEAMNRGLAFVLGGDRSHNRDRIARLPGSINQNSGKRAEIVTLTGQLYDPADLDFLITADRPVTADHSVGADDDGIVIETLASSYVNKWPRLSQESWQYISRRPKKRAYGYDRSDMEQSIFVALVYQGWTDQEIIDFAGRYRLPRHVEEVMKTKSYRWIKTSIKKAREWVEEHPLEPSLSLEKTMCMRSDTTPSYTHSDR